MDSVILNKSFHFLHEMYYYMDLLVELHEMIEIAVVTIVVP